MAREIKFRAWDKTESVYADRKTIGNLLYEKFFNDQTDVDEHYTLEECTPFRDRKGNEIWEGDIGKITTESGRVEYFIVEWGVHRREMKSGYTVDIPGFCFRIDGFPSFPIANNYLNGHDLEIIEVVGNIHENPELLPK